MSRTARSEFRETSRVVSLRRQLPIIRGIVCVCVFNTCIRLCIHI
jgi:hypothetical protein